MQRVKLPKSCFDVIGAKWFCFSEMKWLSIIKRKCWDFSRPKPFILQSKFLGFHPDLGQKHSFKIQFSHRTEISSSSPFQGAGNEENVPLREMCLSGRWFPRGSAGYSIVLRLLKSSLDTIAGNSPVLLGGDTEIERGGKEPGLYLLGCERQQLVELRIMG